MNKLDTWWQKVIYVIGWITVIGWILSFALWFITVVVLVGISSY